LGRTSFLCNFIPLKEENSLNVQMEDYASVAQLVEQLICNQRVGGSNPLAGLTAMDLAMAFLNLTRAGTKVAKWGGL
jgi:hypothetical protein